MFRSALRRARTALQPLVTGARASAPHVERRALSTLCASDLAAAGRVSPVAAVRTALRRDIHASSLLHDAASSDSSEKGLYQVLGEELEHERSTYVPSEIIAAGPPAPHSSVCPLPSFKKWAETQPDDGVISFSQCDQCDQHGGSPSMPSRLDF